MTGVYLLAYAGRCLGNLFQLSAVLAPDSSWDGLSLPGKPVTTNPEAVHCLLVYNIVIVTSPGMNNRRALPYD